MEAVRKNKALLTFPQVFPLDLYISSAIVVWVTEVVVLLIFLLVLNIAGFSYTLHDPITLLSMFILLFFFATSLGIICSVIALYLPVVDKIIPMVLRLLFFTSGIFYSPTQLSGHYGSLIYWNPLLNYIEACRGAFAVRVPFPEVKFTYIVSLCFVFVVFGLLLERYVRFKQSG